MLLEHRGVAPTVDPSAYVAPTAVLCGDVRVAQNARILFGAVLTGEDGAITVGERTVIMENAVVRGRARHPVTIGDDVLVGPHAHVNGCAIADEAFIATGASLFPGSRVGAGGEVRVNGVVQVNSAIAEGETVPIGWVAVGDPATLLPPDRHDEIWEIQRRLDFPGTVYGLSREASARERMERQAAWFGAHQADREVS
jgi:carbonic anhydrase/acetyltransferase-like protein (isoleucine patch superfamily)